MLSPPERCTVVPTDTSEWLSEVLEDGQEVLAHRLSFNSQLHLRFGEGFSDAQYHRALIQVFQAPVSGGGTQRVLEWCEAVAVQDDRMRRLASDVLRKLRAVVLGDDTLSVPLVSSPIRLLRGAIRLNAGLRMRPFVAADVAFMVELFAHNLWEQWSDSKDKQCVDPFVQKSCEAFKDTAEIFTSPGIFYLIESDEGERVGMCGLQDLGNGRCELKRMHLYPKARGQGTGKRVVANLIEYAKAHSFNCIELPTIETLPVAIHMYTSMGFMATGKSVSAHGTSAREVFYELALK